MINRINKYEDEFNKNNMKFFCPKFKQTLSEEQLIELVPKYDAWIIGDDLATRKIFENGVKGKLRAAVKWGVGTDNVDFEACKDLNIPITNIPNAFGEEVSDIAIGYLISLGRQIHNIDKATKNGDWFKPCGMSFSNKKVCLVGFGDIGRNIAKKLLAFNMDVWVTDPACQKKDGNIIYNYGHGFDKYTPELLKLLDSINNVNIDNLNKCLENADFIIIAASLNKHTQYLINKNNIILAKRGVKIINISRGQILNENDVIDLLETEFIDSVGLDVFEIEPLPINSKLNKFNKCIFGSHNSSNTLEAVDKTSYKAINYLVDFLQK